MTPDYKAQTLAMIDSLKTICANYGLGNDGNEFKIISQVFLYKYLNDKYAYTVKQLDERLANNPQWEKALAEMSEDEREMLNMMVVDTAKLEPHHLINYLYARQNDDDFAKLFDDTLIDIAVKNRHQFHTWNGIDNLVGNTTSHKASTNHPHANGVACFCSCL